MYQLLLGIIGIFGLTGILQAQQDAFPGAEGFGRYATGGRGGDVYHVTSLIDGGPGSLRVGIAGATGPRTIVFDVSGNIELNDRLKIEKPNITIAGQTAPGDGITLAGEYLSVNSDHIIIRYIRVRLGDQSGGDDDAVSINDGSNIIFDHVSASWSIDETFSCQSDEVDSLTVQWCMVTESLRDSHHDKGMHGYGGIIGSTRQSFHHNLYAHHSSRSPKVSWRQHGEVDFRNNVIYNWGYNNCYDGSSCYMNWANNYYKAGPGTSSGVRDRIFQLNDKDTSSTMTDGVYHYEIYETSLYANGNYVEGYPAVTADNWGGIDYSDGATEQEHRANTPFDFPPITEQTAEEAYPLVVAGAGASKNRDVIDERIASEVLTGTTTYNGSVSGDPGIIDSQDDVGGWPVLEEVTRDLDFDTDLDGMPDVWESENGLNPNDPGDRNDDRNSDGYTNLEEYLHAVISMISVHVKHRIEESVTILCYPNPTNAGFSIDLSTMGNSTVEVYNLFGQLVYNEVSTKSVHVINDLNLPSGIYVINVTNNSKKSYTQKLIIK